MKEIVILDALRTPIGKYKGAYADFSSVDLGLAAVKAIIERNESVKADISEVIFGSVLTGGQGQNIARQIAVKSGLPVEIPAFTLNEVCGSGLKSILLARQAIALGEAEVILAGGTESMTNAETMRIDGLNDAFENIPMGLTVERLNEEFAISREMQDRFALESHEKALKADFSTELIEFGSLKADQSPRPDSDLEKLAKLRTVFKENGTITAANASSVNDGASVLLLASRDYAEAKGLKFLTVIKDSVEIGVEPERMAISPIKAISRLLERNHLSLEQISFFEINEAFAGSSLIIEKELGLDHRKVNVKGGAISLGHPLGMTGSRLATTLSHQLLDGNKRYGIASLCIGGGMGIALLLENPNV